MFFQKLMPVLAKEQLEIPADLRGKVDVREYVRQELFAKARAFVHAGISVIEATCRASNYRLVIDEVLQPLTKEVPGAIPAMGTQSNIVSIHYAAQRGIE